MCRFRIAFIVIADVFAAACGGSGSSDPVTPSLAIDPTEWSVSAGGAPKQFTATLTGSSDPVAWSIETAGTAAEVGTISAAGLYTPPPSLAVGRDVVVKATAGALVARATVHVGAAVDGVTLAVTPPTGSVVAGSGDTVALHAETSYAGTVTWTVVPDLGMLDATSGVDVTYTAPATLVTATTDVVVTATAGPVSDSTTITVHPTVLVVTGPATVRAGGAPVQFTLVTDVGGSAVAWTVTPASAGTMSGTGSVGTFTPAATAAADTPFQVVATVGEATGSASSTLLPPLAGPITVAGWVVDHEGAGYAGATVIVGDQSTISGADGSFSIPSVTPPYDVTVIADLSASGGKISVYRGVTTAGPVLSFVRALTSRSATVQGRVTYESVGVPGTKVFGPLLSTTAGTNGDYSLFTVWTGAASETVTHRALLVGLDASARPSGYLFGSRAVTVTAGATVTGQDIALGAVSSGHVTGATTPQGDLDYTTSRFAMVAHFTDGTVFTVYDRSFSFEDALVGAFDVIVPTLPDATVRLAYGVSGTSGGRARAKARVAPGQTGVALALPLIPTATAPADGATGVGYGTPFTWTGANAGGMDYLDVDCAGGVSYRIYGGGTSATLPDLSAYGVTLAPGVSCTWEPGWTSYTVEDLVQGPAAVDALALERGAYGPTLSFGF
ncbi:MAG TPA: carboxypeptidase-like regulatory domain-containing protein [Anaeromyxobacteraceae bacterium]|nr:carboxypeptidase-like regulatory domain-containing protein [Anaeromyxobacteraceae bacterium]